MKCQIVSIGDELLLGDTVNTNASWLGQVLAEHGVEVTQVHMISDNGLMIKQTLRRAMRESDLVITTGGLGPTHDDITKKTVAELFDVEMTIHEPTLKFIKKIFKQRNIPFSKSNYYQAEVPENCEVLFNKQGTAPGLWFEESDSRLAVLPGIPHEMKGLIETEVLPKIDALTDGITRRFAFHIKMAGVGESTLSDEIIGSLHDFLSDDLTVAYLPSPQANTLRINVQAKSEQEAMDKTRELKKYIYARADDMIIGEGKDMTLSEATGNILRENKLNISVAESCTGGLLANTITDTPGSSDYMMGGIVAYANSIKTEQLKVSEKDLKEYGAVSKQVALQMARGVATVMNSDIGVSTTGIAGPGGGTDEKPVGTVWIGFWSTNHHFALHIQLTKDRNINKQRTVAITLEMVRRIASGVETMPYGLKPHFA
ncbi:MAG: competence/damage-inducible protein A [Balneolaceae bacterium]|nr:competence/damage-inducible protein A [Balneolaceae bacterium]